MLSAGTENAKNIKDVKIVKIDHKDEEDNINLKSVNHESLIDSLHKYSAFSVAEIQSTGREMNVWLAISILRVETYAIRYAGHVVHFEVSSIHWIHFVLLGELKKAKLPKPIGCITDNNLLNEFTWNLLCSIWQSLTMEGQYCPGSRICGGRESCERITRPRIQQCGTLLRFKSGKPLKGLDPDLQSAIIEIKLIAAGYLKLEGACALTWNWCFLIK